MAMSRRKQLHPKSLKDGDESLFVLPDELKYDEESHDVLTRMEIKQGHQFGPYPVLLYSSSSTSTTDCETKSHCQMTVIGQIDPTQIEHQYQLIEKKHNWLTRCLISNPSSANFNVNFQDEQLFLIALQTIPVSTRLLINVNILPKLNPMETDVKSSNTNEIIKIKEEPIQSDENQTKTKKTPLALLFTCEDCGIRFSNRTTLDAHRSHYCTKRETQSSNSENSTTTTTTTKIKSFKRKNIDSTEFSIPSKRSNGSSSQSTETYCSECDILFTKAENFLQHKLYYCGNSSNDSQKFRRPIQIGQFIYVPVPINFDTDKTSDDDDEQMKPLDLSKPKKISSRDNVEENRVKMTSPLDLTMEKSTNLFQLLNVNTTKSMKTTSSSFLPPQQIYECDFCSIRFSSMKTLQAHQENYCLEYRKHKKTSTENERRSSSPVSSSSSSTNVKSNSNSISPVDCSSTMILPHRSSPFMCRLCKYRGNTLRGMRMHFKFHLSNNEPCTDDDIIITSTISSTNSTIVSTQILFKCTICSAMFDHEETLINHLKCVHTKENLCECSECHSRFSSKWNLIRHMKLTHTNLKCDEDDLEADEDQEDGDQICQDEKLDDDQNLQSPNENQSDPVNLTRHVLIESINADGKKKISSKSFFLKKKFACPYCYIKFGSIDTLKQHMTNYCSSRPSKSDEKDERSSTTTKKKKSNNVSTGETFCSTCQIPFRHKSSYEAHKMYYCRSNVKMQA